MKTEVMKKKRNWHDYVGLVGMVLIPLAPAVATSWAVYEWLSLKGVLLPLAILAGCAAGPGVEAFLALTGDTLLTLKPRENKSWWLVVCIMIAYPVMGVSYYGFNVVGMLFVMAVLFYVVVAVRRQVTVKAERNVALIEAELEADVLQQQTEREQLAWKREQQALQLAHQRELERMKLETAAPVPASPTVLRKQLRVPVAEWSQYMRWSDVPEEARRAAGKMDKGEFKYQFAHLPETTRRRWWGKLGVYRHG